MPRIPDQGRLRHGPYDPPALRVGDRADCLMRGAVVVTSWTDARILWPRCKRQGKSHPSLLLHDELARAVRAEAVEAVRYWWGVSNGVVHRWRRLLSVTRTNNPGTHRLVRANAQAGGHAAKTKEWTEVERQAKRETAQRLDLGRHPKPGYHGPRWTTAQMRLLGKLPDAEVAARIERTVGAVRQKRNLAGIPTARDGRRRGSG
jgi:hypothetical protein